MRDDRAVIGIGVGSGLAAGAAANHVAMGAVGASGAISKGFATLAAAGDQGWDVDGNFVCSKFVFNFRCSQIFDSINTYSVWEIDGVSVDGTCVIISRKGTFTRVPVGVPERVETILYLIREMQAGAMFAPDGSRRLKTVGSRSRSIGLGTVLRFSWHAAVFGFVLTFVTAFFTGPPIRMFVFQLWFFALLFAFIGIRALRRGRIPSWLTSDRPSKAKRVVGLASLAVSAFLVYGVRSNVEDFNHYRGRPAIEVMEACSSYTYTGTVSEYLQPLKWWCGSMEDEVLKGRDDAFSKWLKTH